MKTVLESPEIDNQNIIERICEYYSLDKGDLDYLAMSGFDAVLDADKLIYFKIRDGSFGLEVDLYNRTLHVKTEGILQKRPAQLKYIIVLDPDNDNIRENLYKRNIVEGVYRDIADGVLDLWFYNAKEDKVENLGIKETLLAI